MAGERDLRTLLATLAPRLLPAEYVFLQLADQRLTARLTALNPLAIVREDEGLTLVVPRDVAKARGYPCETALRCITLDVHSSLEAVGLTAACTQALAARGISANVIAGYSHDHIFVPAARAQEALAALEGLHG